jgi:hypothetical protein
MSGNATASFFGVKLSSEFILNHAAAAAAVVR